MLYGDISPRVGVWAWGKMLKRATALMVLERFAQVVPYPKNKGQTAKARRYNRFTSLALSPLQEGVTPDESTISYTDVQCTLEQFGRLVKITDVIQDTHEDPIISEFSDILGEDLEELIETLNWYILRGGTSVRFTNGSARTDVNTVVKIADLKIVERALLASKARYWTKILDGTPKIGTLPIAAAFVVFGHTDLKADLENLTGWKSVFEYSNAGQRLHEYEVGSWGNFRFILSPLFAPFLDAGGAFAGSGTNMKTTSGVLSDIYPLIVLSPNAWALTPLRGANSGKVMVINPDKPSKSDPLGQRGFISYKTWHTGMITDDSLMYRIEVAVKATPS